jgi:hypothetical protein
MKDVCSVQCAYLFFVLCSLVIPWLSGTVANAAMYRQCMQLVRPSPFGLHFRSGGSARVVSSLECGASHPVFDSSWPCPW